MLFLEACTDMGFCPGSALRQLDRQLFSLINGIHFPGSDLVLGWVTWLGDGKVAAVLAVAGLLLLDRRNFWRNFLFLAGAIALSTVAVHLVKAWMVRPRPLADMGGFLPVRSRCR